MIRRHIAAIAATAALCLGIQGGGHRRGAELFCSAEQQYGYCENDFAGTFEGTNSSCNNTACSGAGGAACSVPFPTEGGTPDCQQTAVALDGNQSAKIAVGADFVKHLIAAPLPTGNVCYTFSYRGEFGSNEADGIFHFRAFSTFSDAGHRIKLSNLTATCGPGGGDFCIQILCGGLDNSPLMFLDNGIKYRIEWEMDNANTRAELHAWAGGVEVGTGIVCNHSLGTYRAPNGMQNSVNASAITGYFYVDNAAWWHSADGCDAVPDPTS